MSRYWTRLPSTFAKVAAISSGRRVQYRSRGTISFSDMGRRVDKCTNHDPSDVFVRWRRIQALAQWHGHDAKLGDHLQNPEIIVSKPSRIDRDHVHAGMVFPIWGAGSISAPTATRAMSPFDGGAFKPWPNGKGMMPSWAITSRTQK